MSWQETLDRITNLLVKDKHKYDRNDRLFNERIVIEILNHTQILTAMQTWLDEKSKVDRDICSKDYERAEYFRKEGNRCYVQGSNEKALQMYNDSIRHYPTDSSKSKHGMSLAYANRSAVFFNWMEYRKCLDDIKRAFELGYPKMIEHKLFKRKAECLIELGESAESTIALSAAKKSVMENQKEAQGMDRIVSSIDELLAKIRNSEPGENPKMCRVEPEVPKVTDGSSKKLPSASNGVKLSYNASAGRHLTAKKNLKPGDVLIVEKPFASKVMQRFCKSSCGHCLKKTNSIVPCGQCCTQSYCSEKCQRESWHQKHYFECSHVIKLHEVGIASIALDVVLKTDVCSLLEERVKSIESEVEKAVVPFGMANETICGDYKSIYSLTANTTKIDLNHLMEYAITATVLLLLLRQGEFFIRQEIAASKVTSLYHKYSHLCCELPSELLTEKKGKISVDFIELLYGGLMFKHIQQIVCNGIAVTGILDLDDATSKIGTYEQVQLGTALYPTVSLVNHSCDPNCLLTFAGSTIVMKVMKEVVPDQAITVSYGPIFSKQSWEQRQQALHSQYYFTCSCAKCLEGPELEFDLCSFKCQHCEGVISELSSRHCSSCQKPFDPNWFREENKKVTGLLQNCFLSSKGPISELKKMLKVGDKIFHKYNKNLSGIHNVMARSYAYQADYQKAKYHFEKALEIEKFLNGEESIEVGHCLETYSDLLMECLRMKMARKGANYAEVEECLKIVQKAIKIISLASGNITDSAELTNLKEKENILLGFLRSERS